MRMAVRCAFRLVCAGLVAIVPSVARAQSEAANYPNKPARMVVPFAPGGSSEIVGRLIAQKLTELWGQPFIIDNRPGGGGSIGAETVARATPDGYTILFTNPGPGLHNVLLRQKPSYTLNDFAPIVYIGYSSNLIVANPKFPPNNVRELVAYAKANPGKVNWASPGTNSNPHISLELLKAVTGIDVVHIPYKGSGPALTDVVGGQVDALYASPISAETFLKAGRLKILGISGTKRNPGMPDVPTFAEQGVQGADSVLWFGLLTAAGTPRSLIEKINGGVNKAMQMPDLRQRLEQLGVEIEGGPPEKFGAFIRSEAARLAPLIKSGALRIE
jgi:tripartite-type tricarboxylate transporter receptor subunit TctC